MSCPMECGPQVGVIGMPVELTIKDCDGVVIDVSDATAMTIYLKAPDGGVLTKTAAFTTDGTDGKIEYVTIDGDIDEAGTWRAQGRVVTPDGDYASLPTSFAVYDNLFAAV